MQLIGFSGTVALTGTNANANGDEGLDFNTIGGLLIGNVSASNNGNTGLEAENIAGSVSIAAGGVVLIDGNVLSGPSRSVAGTRLTGVALTKLDVLDSFAEIPVGIAYQLDGSRCDEFPSSVELLERARPVYEALPGWRRPTGEARTLDDLPREARAYLDRLQELAGVPIRYVSVGTRRDQIISL